MNLFVVSFQPDPLGVLEPGEVYIESSSLNLTAADGKTFTSRYTGPALVSLEHDFSGSVKAQRCFPQVTRHPCKVATDVQQVWTLSHFFQGCIFQRLLPQVLAVDRAELHGLCDVVIVSTKGHRVHGETLPRHLLSMLGGGRH